MAAKPYSVCGNFFRLPKGRSDLRNNVRLDHAICWLPKTFVDVLLSIRIWVCIVRPNLGQPFNRRTSVGGNLISDHSASLHYESNPLQFGDICNWISGDGNEVGELACFDTTDAVLPPEHLCRSYG